MSGGPHRTVRRGAVAVLALVVLFGAGCTATEDEASRNGKEPGDQRTPATTTSGARFGPCEDVTLEEYQLIFGDRFAAVKVGGTAQDCTIVAARTYLGESITIRDSDRAGYGEDYDAAREAVSSDFLCPTSAHEVEGLGERAFYVTTCDPKERPNESLHIEIDGRHLTYSAFFVPADRIAGTEDALVGIATRQLT